jgi:modulator of FtsH protease
MSDQNSVLASSVSAQQVTNKVLRNTYALLGITLIPTVIGALIGMSMNFSFAAQHPFIFAIGSNLFVRLDARPYLATRLALA